MSILFYMYILASFSVLLGIGIVVLMISRKDIIKGTQYKSVMLFMTAVFLFCVGYFYLFCKDSLLDDYTVGSIGKITGSLWYALIIFAWLLVIRDFRKNDGAIETGYIFLWAVTISSVRLIVSSTAMILFANEYYSFTNETYGQIYSIIEAIYVLITVSVVVYYSQDFIRKTVNSRYGRYVLVISVTFCLWDVFQAIIDFALYSGRFISAWEAGIPDINGLVMFIMGIGTFVFVFREDFSPLFYVSKKEQEVKVSNLDYAAEKHSLTIREAEVMQLMYNGYNNPEIAEKLVISRNTVKRHVQSIYEKMGIASRVELIHLVDTRPDDIK